MDSICGGRLPEPVSHDGDFNTHRLCINGVDSSGGVVPIQLNETDLEWFRWIFDALDGKKSSWLSLIPPGDMPCAPALSPNLTPSGPLRPGQMGGHDPDESLTED